jgi:hypothetical protein
MPTCFPEKTKRGNGEQEERKGTEIKSTCAEKLNPQHKKKIQTQALIANAART